MTDAEWKATHTDYKGSREMGQGARGRGFGRPEVASEETSPHGLHRVRVVIRPGGLRPVFITDAKVKLPPAAEEGAERATIAAPEPAPRPAPAAQPQPEAPEGSADIEAMRQSLKGGGVQTVTAPELFPTPAELADRVVALAGIPATGCRVLEPSAGTGSLLNALPGVLSSGLRRQSVCDVVAVEINPTLARMLTNLGKAQQVICADFLECEPGTLGLFDAVVMNPPFGGAADIEHIQHARRFLAPGGTLVAICAGGPRQRAALQTLVEDTGGIFEELPAGSFAECGTLVNTALVVIHA
jgi:predicted RNA methylase